MSARVYIGRLPSDVGEKSLERFFKGYGRIQEILIKNGFGFVEFDNYRDADDAVYELNGKELHGTRLTIEHARGSSRGNDNYRDRNRGYRTPMYNRRRQGPGRDKYGPPTRTEYRLIVENLSSRVSWQDLKDYMRQAGEVTYADAHKQRRNEGVVEFASLTDMKNALDKLDDTDLSGRRIKLVEDKSRRRSRVRSRSKSRSRSDSRSRSRSRSKSRSESRSRSRSKSRSRSRSVSPPLRSSRSHSKKESRSRSRSRSRSASQDRKSRSRSKSNRSRSRSHSQSKSPKKCSPSPVQKDEDVSNSAEEKI